jgi:diaminopimelate epimerase
MGLSIKSFPITSSSSGKKTSLDFCKYVGAGNDFVLIDNRTDFFPLHDAQLVARLCHRQFGIGADGLCFLCSGELSPLCMRIFNSDGTEAQMCGNGLRCFKLFCDRLGVAKPLERIEVGGRLYETETRSAGQVAVAMGTLPLPQLGVEVETAQGSYTVDWAVVGVPHLVCYVEDIETAPVTSIGPLLRSHSQFGPAGANVNFVQRLDLQSIALRTYERGVGETLACGTGCTAAALAIAARSRAHKGSCSARVASGSLLTIDYVRSETAFEEVVLTGPAQATFVGCWDLGD